MSTSLPANIKGKPRATYSLCFNELSKLTPFLCKPNVPTLRCQIDHPMHYPSEHREIQLDHQ